MQNNLYPISKIAVLNPYLQGGHTETAEIESTKRFILTAQQRGIDVKMFATSEEIANYDPDLVINITYQEGKLTKYPTYLSVNVAMSLIEDVPRFIRNILSYDGFFTASSTVVQWLENLFKTHNKTAPICWGYFTLSRTSFSQCDFKNATAMYIGTNWDGLRHHDLFQGLSSGEYIKCYGPKKSWAHYPSSLYGGEIPFDGVSTLNTYRQHGAGLCIGLSACDQEGIANNRLFETAAAGAVLICSENEFTKNIYGDSVLYINQHLPTKELSEQIVDSIKWIRSNSEKSLEMAHQTHSIFNEKLSMEVFIDDLIQMHQKVMREKGYITNVKVNNTVPSTIKEMPKVTYIVLTENSASQAISNVQDILNQTYPNIDVVLLTKNGCPDVSSLFQHTKTENLSLHSICYEGVDRNQQLLNYLQKNNTRWVGILTPSSRIFPNHTAMLLEKLSSSAKTDKPISAIFSGNLEYSEYVTLEETMRDAHNICNKNKIRIHQLNFNMQTTPQNTLLFNLELLAANSFAVFDFYNLNLSAMMLNKGIILETNEITCATNTDSLLIKQLLTDKASLIEIEKKLVEAKIIELEQAIQAQAKIVNQQQDLIQGQSNEINDIYTSRSWRYSAPLRKLIKMGRWLKSRESVVSSE